jgi:ATP-binding cassette, subfamily C, bacterial
MLLKSTVNVLQAEATARLSSGFLADLRISIYRALTEASWLYLAKLRSSTFTHALTAQAEQVSNGATIMLRLMANGFSMLAGIAVALVLSPGLTLAAVAAGILIALPMTYFDMRAYRIGTKSWQVMQSIYEQLARHFSGLKAARACRPRSAIGMTSTSSRATTPDRPHACPQFGRHRFHP